MIETAMHLFVCVILLSAATIGMSFVGIMIVWLIDEIKVL